MSNHVVSVQNFSKVYQVGWKFKKVSAVNDLSFDVPYGQVIGLLGPNGAGKSTTINTILGFTFPSSGSVRVLDHSPGDHRILNKIGLVCEIQPKLSGLTAYEQLRYFGKLSNVSDSDLKIRIPNLLEKFGLAEDAKRTVEGFSKGMVQRLGFALALIHDPELIILDEPTSGLDPSGRKLIADLIMELRQAGKTILFSTHILSDVEKICDHVIIINKGKLAAATAVHRESNLYTVKFFRDKGKNNIEIGELNNRLQVASDYFQVKRLTKEEKNFLLKELQRKEIDILGVSEDRLSIEELYSTATREES